MKLLSLFILFLLTLPFLVMISISITTSEFTITPSAFTELFKSYRIQELILIMKRSFVVCLITTPISYFVAYTIQFIFRQKSSIIYLFALSLPFIISEPIRIFSWHALISKNGIINYVLSSLSITNEPLLEGASPFNVYLMLIISFIPISVFINYIGLQTIPSYYITQCRDLKMNQFWSWYKVILPLSLHSLLLSSTVVFFMAMASSTEIDFMGGDTKVTMHNFVSSLLSASRYNSVFAMGTIMTLISACTTYFFYKIISNRN